MDKKVEMKRVNFRISADVYDYYKERSNKMGLGFGAIMYLALDKQKEQDEMMKNVPDMLRKMDELQDELETYKKKSEQTLLP